jgi:hypothetical protein
VSSDIRAALERLLGAVDAYEATGMDVLDDAIAAARAALAAEVVGEVEVTLELMAALIEIQRLRDLCQTLATPPAPEVGEVGDAAVEEHLSAEWPSLSMDFAAPAPVAVPVAVCERLPEPEDCDDHQECWAWDTGAESWILEHYENCKLFTHWLPHHAIPLPQAGEDPNA